MPHAINAADLANQLGLGLPIQILDVRRLPAYEASPHLITGANWMNPEHIGVWMNDIAKECRVVVYCVHGHQVSQGCATILERSGFEVSYLEGGIEQWLAEDRPTRAK